MTQTKRNFSAVAIFALVLLILALSINVMATPSYASLVTTRAIPVETVPQTPAPPYADNSFTTALSYSGAVRLVIAQNEIPDVLVPSVVPQAEPTTLAQGSPTPKAPIGPTKISNNTTKYSTGAGFDLSRIFGSISPLFIIALVPLLFIIGALFYFFFMGDQERGAPEEDREADIEPSDIDEDTGWREL